MEQTKVRSGYRQLRAWQRADELAFGLVNLARTLPREYRWLVPQLARAAISIPANIAEGYSRASLREYLHHLSIARGSLAETEYYLHLINRLGLLSIGQHDLLHSNLTETASLLYGLIRSLSKKLDQQTGQRPYAIKEAPATLQGNDALSDDLGP